MEAVIFMLRRFLYGRYGSDQLNIAMLIGMAVLSVLNCILYFLLGSGLLYALLSVAVDTLLVLSVFRMFSRNIPRRQAENQAWQNFLTRLRDRDNRYFRCPSCKQRVRVPRGRGKINIRCPKCGEKFIRKT